MQKNLVEAQREHYFLGSEKQYHIEAKLVRCLGRLSQNLGGLRSAASTQFAILRKALDQTIGIDRTPFSWSVGTNTPNKSRTGSVSRSGLLDVINEDSEESDERPSTSNTWDGASTPSRSRPGMSFHDIVWKATGKSGTSTPANDLLAPADMFVTFIDQLGPPAKSLVFTLKQILCLLRRALPRQLGHGNRTIHQLPQGSAGDAVSLKITQWSSASRGTCRPRRSCCELRTFQFFLA
jgi:hypothetical protein